MRIPENQAAPQAPIIIPSVRGDRAPNRNVVYPTGAYESAGGPVFSIKAAPYNARGDGVTDDTQAFIDAIDHAYAAMGAPNGAWSSSGWTARYTQARIIYIPNGTYLVSNTLKWSLPLSSNHTGHIKVQGQSRSGTIIKLKDNCAGYQSASTPKYVLNTAEEDDFNNVVGLNLIRDLTVDTGSGNPGAMGIAWMGANHNELRNVKVIGSGVCGIRCWQAPVCTYIRDIVVEGHQYGLWVAAPARATNLTFEFITVRNQTVAGVYVNWSTAAVIRSLFSEQGAVPGVIVNDAGAHVTILDSELRGSPAETAFRGTTGNFFMRNIVTSGYSSAAIRGATVVVGPGNVQEYVSGTVFKKSGSTRTRTLDIPIEDPPEVPYAPPSDWARPQDFANTQAALNSGRSHIYITTSGSIGTVNVPATVTRISFMMRGASGTLHVTGASSTPLIIEDIANTINVYIDAARVVELNFCPWGKMFRGTYGGNITTFNSNSNGCLPPTHGSRSGIKAYVRAADHEQAQLPMDINNGNESNGGHTVVLGAKAEAGTSSWRISNGARFEIFGFNEGVNAASTFITISGSSGNIVASVGEAYPDSYHFIEDGTTTILEGSLPVRPNHNTGHGGGTTTGRVCPLYLTS